jgi:S-adenosylmethionine-diacylgycerolhomoserine-N-methlytransferase
MLDDTETRMDRMYRHQRYIYDMTRKFYLLGRDRLIENLALQDGDCVAEIGCGTGRNLVALAGRHPRARFYGLDASAAMLEIAKKQARHAGHRERIYLAVGLGEQLDPRKMFGLDRKFDAVVISYALTMIPSWPAVAERAIECLRPGGTLAVVDFWDQRDLPVVFGRALRAWLALFDVTPRSDMPDFFRRLAAERGGAVTVQPIARRYAFHLTYAAPLAA